MRSAKGVCDQEVNDVAWRSSYLTCKKTLFKNTDVLRNYNYKVFVAWGVFDHDAMEQCLIFVCTSRSTSTNVAVTQYTYLLTSEGSNSNVKCIKAIKHEGEDEHETIFF